MTSVVRFDGEIFVSYGFLYLDSGVGGCEVDLDQRAGQRNGLAGGMQDGFVFLTTGTNTGWLPLRVEEHESEPALAEDSWDEVVEVSCDFRGADLELSAFDGPVAEFSVAQNGPHRLRYAARRFDAEDEGPGPAQECYLLQLWPAPMRTDAVIRKTSAGAAYWHRLARKAKATRASPIDRARAELAEEDREAADQAAYEVQAELWGWGGREPSARLRALGSAPLAIRHRDLVDEIESLSPEQQRRLALSIAHQACADDRDSPVDWTPALAALDRGEPLPAPYDDNDQLMDLLYGSAPVTYEVTIRLAEPDEPARIDTGVVAAAAVQGAAHVDPFAAALSAAEAASWREPDARRFAAWLRTRLPSR